MIRLAVDNSAVVTAWNAFDAAAIRFYRMYGQLDGPFDSDAARTERMAAAQEVARLWDEWRELFLGPDGGSEPRPAA